MTEMRFREFERAAERKEEGEESCKGGFGRRRMTGTRAKSGRAERAGHGRDGKEDEEQTRRLGSVAARRMRGEGLGRDEGEPPRRVSEFAALNMVDSRIGCAVAGRYGPHHRPADCTRYCIPTILRHVLFSLSSPPPLALSLSLSPSLPPSSPPSAFISPRG